MIYQVENVEPNRVIFTNPEDKSFITIAIHDDDKDALEELKSFKPGEKYEISIEPVQAEEPPQEEVKDPNEDQFTEELKQQEQE